MNALSFRKNSKNDKLLSSLLGAHVSKMGYTFDFLAEKWQLSGSEGISFARFPELDDEVELGLRSALSRYAEEYSDRHASNMANRCLSYFKTTKSGFISSEGIAKYRDTLDKHNEWWIGAVKGFWLAWYDWGFPGISKDAVELLENMVLGGNKKGQAVKKMCPYTGPFTELEQSALLDWAANAFQNSTIDLPVYAYFISLLFTGRRAIQIRAIRACDLSRKERKDAQEFELRVPRAKQRGVLFRGEFSTISISEDFYLLLSNLIEESLGEIERMYGCSPTEKIRQELPIFINWERLRQSETIFEIEEKLEGSMPDFLHLNAAQSEYMLRQFGIKSEAKSERTGDYIHLSSRRFRYTKAKNLANKGISGVALAAALDHTDTQNIGVYTENTSKNAEIINKVMVNVLAPLAQAFAGTLIDSERDAIRANDPHSRIKNLESNVIGSCGTYSFCASGYRACYTCVKFQPWRDAPHHEVLEEILEERERQKAANVSEKVIQATDRLLLAVKQVISLCETAKKEEKEKDAVDA